MARNRRSSTKPLPNAKKASEGASDGRTVLSLVGHQWERAGICAECQGPLVASDGHYHSRKIYAGYGAEAICCKETNLPCKDVPIPKLSEEALALVTRSGVLYSYQEADTEGGDSDNNTTRQGRSANVRRETITEEQEVSKTSQKNAAVAKAVKGQAAAKKAKANTNGKVPKEPKPEYTPVLLPANYKGNAVGEVQATGKQFLDSVHGVADGKTFCGYDTQKTSKGELRLGVNRVPTKAAINCGRCLRFQNKEAAPKTEKAKPAKKAVAKKVAAATAAE